MTGWDFQSVEDRFQEHVAAHLPGYADVQQLCALISQFAVGPGETVADIGASSGQTAETIHAAIGDRNPRYVLYDENSVMLRQAADRAIPDLTTVCRTLSPEQRLCGLTHTNASLTLALWSLQFMPPMMRIPLLSAARAASSDSGAIVIGAKTVHADARTQEIAVAALDDYKAAQGVSAEERANKTNSLRGILRVDSGDEVRQQLYAAGWESATLIWRWHVWSVFLAWARR